MLIIFKLKTNSLNETDADFTPMQALGVTPPLVRSIWVFRRYAVRKGRYAVRKNPVILYADTNVYFNNVQFSSRNTTNVTYKVK